MLLWFLIEYISYYNGNCFQRLFSDRLYPLIEEGFKNGITL